MNSGITTQAGSADHDPVAGITLANAIAAGNPEAEQLFVGRYLPQVRAMLTARLRDYDQAEDLLQDTMLEAICALRRGQLRDAEKLTFFVLGIARNVLNSHYRKAVRQPVSLEFPDNLPDLNSAVETLESEQRVIAVAAALATLDPVDRRILEMTLHDCLKPGEIARRLGLSSDVVRQRKVRGTRRIVDLVRRQSQNLIPDHSTSGQTR